MEYIKKNKQNLTGVIISDYLMDLKLKEEKEDIIFNELIKNKDLGLSIEIMKNAHSGQVNKVDGEPFHNHPLGVGKIISRFTDNIELIQAGLAHDIIEDCNNGEAVVKDSFGNNVLELVKGVTELDKSYSWHDRKTAYIEHLSEANLEVIILSIADHIHNIHRVIKEYIQLGEDLWSNFSVGKERKIEYFIIYLDKVTKQLKRFEKQENYNSLNNILIEYQELLDVFNQIINTEGGNNIVGEKNS